MSVLIDNTYQMGGSDWNGQSRFRIRSLLTLGRPATNEMENIGALMVAVLGIITSTNAGRFDPSKVGPLPPPPSYFMNAVSNCCVKYVYIYFIIFIF